MVTISPMVSESTKVPPAKEADKNHAFAGLSKLRIAILTVAGTVDFYDAIRNVFAFQLGLTDTLPPIFNDFNRFATVSGGRFATSCSGLVPFTQRLFVSFASFAAYVAIHKLSDPHSFRLQLN
jgi:hypothetical protein